MRQSLATFRPLIAPTIARRLPAGAGFVIAGFGSVLFWAMIAGIAAIV